MVNGFLMSEFFYLILLFPLFGFFINGLFGKKINSEKIIGLIGSISILIPFLIAVQIFMEMLFKSGEKKLIYNFFEWIKVGKFSTSFAFILDELSILFTLVITGVGFLIHLYSIGYMKGDRGFARFFAYLNLFIVMMLILVLADNFLLMFLGWEGVGLCSYLLIGFWYDRKFEVGGYEKKSLTVDAAKKAFVVNRIGDFGFLLAIFMIFSKFETLDFTNVFKHVSNFGIDETTVTLITLFLFIGAIGKSAQIPLFVWLPDAMAGPTPVSALIHAATMVTSGIYMIARCSILFSLSPITMQVVATIGILTTLIAASIGLVQNDIKKILAYSTVSQLGYMFLGLGVGAFTAGVFHVITHAFFKALLFLGAGSVIHSLNEEQNIRKMGGLKKYMPITYKTFFVGTLAITGIPPLAGFFSKDEILWKTFESGNVLFWVLGIFGAMMTAFYMFRLFYLTFLKSPRFDEKYIHPHESPKTMTTTLTILAVLSGIGGLIGVPSILGGNSFLHHWLEPIFGKGSLKFGAHKFSHFTEYLLMFISILVVVISIFYARKIFLKTETIENNAKGFRKILFNKYYVDEIYEFLFVNPIFQMSKNFLWKIFDIKIIDGVVNGVASIIEKISFKFKYIQTGMVQTYLSVFLFGVVVIIFILLI